MGRRSRSYRGPPGSFGPEVGTVHLQKERYFPETPREYIGWGGADAAGRGHYSQRVMTGKLTEHSQPASLPGQGQSPAVQVEEVKTFTNRQVGGPTGEALESRIHPVRSCQPSDWFAEGGPHRFLALFSPEAYQVKDYFKK